MSSGFVGVSAGLLGFKQLKISGDLKQEIGWMRLGSQESILISLEFKISKD
jgi:hypothetical protein